MFPILSSAQIFTHLNIMDLIWLLRCFADLKGSHFGVYRLPCVCEGKRVKWSCRRRGSPPSRWDWLCLCSRCSRTAWRCPSWSSDTAETREAGCPRPSPAPWWWPRTWRRAGQRPSRRACPGTRGHVCTGQRSQRRRCYSETESVPARVKPERSSVRRRSPGCFSQLSLECWCFPDGSIYPGLANGKKQGTNVFI